MTTTPIAKKAAKKKESIENKPEPVSQARRYQLSWNKLYSELPPWKRIAIDESMKKENKTDSLLDAFTLEVIKLAEDEKEELFITC